MWNSPNYGCQVHAPRGFVPLQSISVKWDAENIIFNKPLGITCYHDVYYFHSNWCPHLCCFYQSISATHLLQASIDVSKLHCNLSMNIFMQLFRWAFLFSTFHEFKLSTKLVVIRDYLWPFPISCNGRGTSCGWFPTALILYSLSKTLHAHDSAYGACVLKYY